MNEVTTVAKDDDVIYALRTAHQNQVQLNQMADQKANILVGLIIIPLTILSTRITDYELDSIQLLIASIFISLEVIAIIICVMVVRPRTMWANHALKIEEISNPLFFGFFTRFSEAEYLAYMQTKMSRNLAARELLLIDIYQIGHVLKRKFQLLKLAYFFAMLGFIFIVVAFVYYLANG